jgi:hypothetical protein
MQRREFPGVFGCGGGRVAARYAFTGDRSHLSPRHNNPLAENRRIVYCSFFDEFRVFGFVEGQNLKVDGGGYHLRASNFPCIHRR